MVKTLNVIGMGSQSIVGELDSNATNIPFSITAKS